MRFALDSGPHVRDEDSTDLIYKRLLLVLIPVVLFSLYKNVFLVLIENRFPILDVLYPLILIVVSCLTTFLTERVYVWIDSSKRGFRKTLPFYSVITGLMISMLLPINTPLYVVILGGIVATVFGKMVYGGFGENSFNPAAVGMIFMMLLFGSVFSNYSNYFNLIEAEKYSTIPISTIGSLNYDTSITPFGTLFNFLFGMVPGGLGTTNGFLMLFSFALLTILKVNKWKVTLGYILTVFFMTFMIGSYFGLEMWYPLFNVLGGSLLFVAVFMSDPVTTATTSTGQILNGIGLGIVTVALRLLTPNPENIILAVVIMNLLVPTLDKLGVKALKESKYSYILVLSSILLVIMSSFIIVSIIK